VSWRVLENHVFFGLRPPRTQPFMGQCEHRMGDCYMGESSLSRRTITHVGAEEVVAVSDVSHVTPI
jgi:hypothetical protein